MEFYEQTIDDKVYIFPRYYRMELGGKPFKFDAAKINTAHDCSMKHIILFAPQFKSHKGKNIVSENKKTLFRCVICGAFDHPYLPGVKAS